MVSQSDLLRRAAAFVFSALFVCALTLTMVGCNTTKGAGKDIEAVGEGIQDAAD